MSDKTQPKKLTKAEKLAVQRKNKREMYLTFDDPTHTTVVKGSSIIGILSDLTLDIRATNVTQAKSLFLYSPTNDIVEIDMAAHIKSDPEIHTPHWAGKLFIFC